MYDPMSQELRRGRQLIEEGRCEEAVAVFDAVLAARPTAVEALHGRALANERLDQLDAALESCNEALALAPHHVPSLVTKGSIHARRGERVSAMECFRRVTRLRPDFVAGHHLLRSVGGEGFDAPLRGEVVDLFDRYAAAFDAHLVERLGYRGHLAVPNAVKSAAGCERADWIVVDLGCGTGLCGPELRPLARRLVGVDVSPEILERARLRGVYDVLYVADLVYAMATMDAGTIDLFVSADVLGYVGDLRAVFAEASRTLRAGGRLAFSVEAHEGPEDFVMDASRRMAYREAYLRRLAEEHALRVERLAATPLRREDDREVVEHITILQR